MSSRSLAAARARRAGEQAPPISGNRPITSINSQYAFSQQPQLQQQRQPYGNVRVARPQPSSQKYQTIKPQQNQQQQNQQQPIRTQQIQQQITQQIDIQQQQNLNGLPFSKLSVSDAIGLITLRLGRVEQWVIETQHENEIKENNENIDSLPPGSKIIDNSVLTVIVNRLDNVEKKLGEFSDTQNTDNCQNYAYNEEVILKINEEIQKIHDELDKINILNANKNIELAKNNEAIFKFNRELTETKDLLKSFMMKYDIFVGEINEKFKDYETALTDLENSLPVETCIQNNLISSDLSKELTDELKLMNIEYNTYNVSNLSDELIDTQKDDNNDSFILNNEINSSIETDIQVSQSLQNMD